MKKLLLKLFADKKGKAVFNPKGLKSVLIRPVGDAIGDAITLTAILKQLKTAFPGVKTGVFVTDRNRPVLEGCPFADELIPLKTVSYFKNRNKWDIFIDCTPTFTTKNIILDYVLAPRYTICLTKRDKKIYNKNTVRNYDFYADMAKTAHITEILSFTPFAPYVKDIKPEYFIKENSAAINKVRGLWPEGKIRILLAPRGSNREISKKDLGIIVSALKDKYREKISFLILNAKDSYALEGVKTTPVLNLNEYFMLVKSADVVIAVDSASVHIANAFNVPVAAVYANSPATKLWAPLKSSRSFVIMPPVRQNSNSLIDGFDVNEAIKAAEYFIKAML